MKHLSFGWVILAALILWGAIVVGVITAANAQPPDSIDPNSATAKWFNSLTDHQGSPCCSLADCRTTDTREQNGRIQALIDGQWVNVPWRKILKREDNPLGKAVVCSLPDTDGPRILCFVRVSEV